MGGIVDLFTRKAPDKESHNCTLAGYAIADLRELFENLKNDVGINGILVVVDRDDCVVDYKLYNLPNTENPFNINTLSFILDKLNND